MFSCPGFVCSWRCATPPFVNFLVLPHDLALCCCLESSALGNTTASTPKHSLLLWLFLVFIALVNLITQLGSNLGLDLRASQEKGALLVC